MAIIRRARQHITRNSPLQPVAARRSPDSIGPMAGAKHMARVTIPMALHAFPLEM